MTSFYGPRGLIAGITDNSAPGIVDSQNPLPLENYKAGQSWRVVEPGYYAGEFCEPGDLILCVKTYKPGANPNDDFIVLQTNLDNAVTGPKTSVEGNLAVYGNIIGTKINDSKVSINAIKDTISKAHVHDNKSILDTYGQTEPEMLNTIDEKIANRVGDIPDGVTIKNFVLEEMNKIGPDLGDALEKVKMQAIQASKDYIDDCFTLVSF